jgi:hypothetical protein
MSCPRDMHRTTVSDERSTLEQAGIADDWAAVA